MPVAINFATGIIFAIDRAAGTVPTSAPHEGKSPIGTIGKRPIKLKQEITQ